MDKIVSVIVPIYNAESTVERCIKSILNQTYFALDIVLVNDGSLDSSLEICNKLKYKDSRIKVINIENGGVSNARNIGMSYAYGDYFCFIDSDDWIEKNHIKNMVNKIENSDCIIEGYIKETKDGIINCALSNMKVNLNSVQNENIGKMFWDGYIHTCWNKLFKRDIINKYKLVFKQDLHISEDSLFCIEYLSHCRNYTTISDLTYHYCIENKDDSLSKRVYPNIFDIYNLVYHDLDTLLDHINCDLSLKKLILTKTIYPQIYSSVLKILTKRNLDINEKRKILKELEKNPEFLDILSQAKKISTNKIEKNLITLIIKKKYRILEMIFKCLTKK